MADKLRHSTTYDLANILVMKFCLTQDDALNLMLQRVIESGPVTEWMVSIAKRIGSGDPTDLTLAQSFLSKKISKQIGQISKQVGN